MLYRSMCQTESSFPRSILVSVLVCVDSPQHSKRSEEIFQYFSQYLALNTRNTILFFSANDKCM